jgi:DNA-binding GntR family transcriptional regulator
MLDGSGKTTEADDSYTRLHQAILGGQLLPNERLIELDLAQRFGVGRAAIRTALARLEQEGLVEREPNRGARVRAISGAEALEMLEARAVLEGLAARYAAHSATESDIATLRSINAQMQERLEADDLLGFSDLNSQFHEQLLRIAGHTTVMRLLERLQAQHVLFQYRMILVSGRAPLSLAEHHAIVEAVAAHHPEAAEAAMRLHLSYAANTLRRMVDTVDSRRL